MTWTPELYARLKGLRDHQDGSDYAWRGYGDELAEADPLSRIEELERRWEALKEWAHTHATTERLQAVRNKMHELEANRG